MLTSTCIAHRPVFNIDAYMPVKPQFTSLAAKCVSLTILVFLLSPALHVYIIRCSWNASHLGMQTGTAHFAVIQDCPTVLVFGLDAFRSMAKPV